MSGIRFDSTNRNWSDIPYQNESFLRTQEVIANSLLRVRGKLPLNAVLDLLGFEETEEGALSGWVNIEIDFGVVHEDDGSISLHFNDNRTNIFSDKN